MLTTAHQIIAWLKNYAETSNRKSFVIGVSGGVDSALVSTLCAMTELPTHCLILPCVSKPEDAERAYKHIKWLQNICPNVFAHTLDLTKTFKSFKDVYWGYKDDDLADANAKSRLRMVALYHMATLAGGLVVGTGNKVEDYSVFFYTKYGDGAVDIAPIGDLMKSEVRQMCRELGVLPELCEAIPTDGLWEDNRTDESQLGASYEELEWAMNYCDHPHKLTVLTTRQEEVLKIYNKWHTAGKHKSLPIPTFKRK